MHSHVCWDIEVGGNDSVRRGSEILQPVDLPETEDISAALNRLTQGQGRECGEFETEGPL